MNETTASSQKTCAQNASHVSQEAPLLIRISPPIIQKCYCQIFTEIGHFSPKIAKKCQFWLILYRFWLIYGILSFRIFSANLTVLPTWI